MQSMTRMIGLRANKRPEQMQTHRFRVWFPVLPFIAYWIFFFAVYHIGIVIRQPLHLNTYFYFITGFLVFIIGYHIATCGVVNVRVRHDPNRAQLTDRRARRYATVLLPVALLGGGIAVVDKLVSGAGSFTRTLEETEIAREYMGQTSLLTTVSVIPSMAMYIALACYFRAIGSRIRVPLMVSLLAAGVLGLLLVNSFLSVNRGQFFWVFSYLLYYAFFVKGDRIRDVLFEKRVFGLRNMILAFALMASVYIVFIAGNRSSEAWNKSVVSSASGGDRYGVLGVIDNPKLAASVVSMESYGTHGFEYIDVWMQNADYLAFRPAFLLGGRFGDQIRRFDPNYQEEALRLGNLWSYQNGLRLFPVAWPSVFGFLLPMFGCVGGVLFLGVLGFLNGRLVRAYLLEGSLGALVIGFALYAALNMSFSWIGGDFSHNCAYVVGVWMLFTERSDRLIEHQWQPNR